MTTLTVIVRSVYLLCLALTVLVALVSYASGTSFTTVMSRIFLTLVGSAFLGWVAIMILIPKPAPLQAEKDQKDNDHPVDKGEGDHPMPTAS